jgi:hypothetical protein
MLSFRLIGFPPLIFLLSVKMKKTIHSQREDGGGGVVNGGVGEEGEGAALRRRGPLCLFEACGFVRTMQVCSSGDKHDKFCRRYKTRFIHIYDKLKARVNPVVDFPETGRIVPELARQGKRV